MTLAITPHLNFRSQARAALNFYKEVFGGTLVAVTYGEFGQGTAENHQHIIWGQVEAADGFRIMAFDILEPRPYDQGTNAFFVSLRGSSVEEIEARWAGLAEDATVLHPLGPAPWSPLYGMLTDRFGVTWIVDVAPKA